MSVSNSFTSEQIDNAIEVLEHAIATHRIWYDSLLEGLLCQQPFPDDITDEKAHTLCGFGYWYYHSDNEAIRSIPEFSALEHSHKALHDTARKLVQAFKADGYVALEAYRSMSGRQNELSRLLDRLRDGVLSQQNALDGLTGLLNRKSIGLILENCHLRALRHHSSYTLAMLDIDHFKQVNDTHGHLAGDEALKAVSGYLASELRDTDSVGRYGGEEFLVLLPDTTPEISERILQRIRRGIADLVIRYEAIEIRLTISIGYASFSASKAVWEVVKDADQALYQAKKLGRNRVEEYQPPEELPDDNAGDAYQSLR